MTLEKNNKISDYEIKINNFNDYNNIYKNNELIISKHMPQIYNIMKQKIKNIIYNKLIIQSEYDNIHLFNIKCEYNEIYKNYYNNIFQNLYNDLKNINYKFRNKFYQFV